MPDAISFSDVSSDSFSYAVADSVDSPASIFSAMGVTSRDFSGDNMRRNWDSFSREAVQVFFDAQPYRITVFAADYQLTDISVQIGGGFVSAPGSLVVASAVSDFIVSI